MNTESTDQAHHRNGTKAPQAALSALSRDEVMSRQLQSLHQYCHRLHTLFTLLRLPPMRSRELNRFAGYRFAGYRGVRRRITV